MRVTAHMVLTMERSYLLELRMADKKITSDTNNFLALT